MLRILIADGIEKNALLKLKEMNFDVVEKQYKPEELIYEIKNFDVLVVRSATKVTKEIIDKGVEGNRLKLIIRGGVGLDNIDVEYAKIKGVVVRNTPNASNTSVAELVIGHMLGMARFLHNSNVTMRKGEWNKKIYEGIEIEGKTLGVVGFGRIGRETAKKARALGMKIAFYDIVDPMLNNNEYKYCTLDELFAISDFISLHVPYNKGDKAVIGKEEIEKMKEGVYLINCARGGVVDEKALLEALDCGKLSGAALDVFLEEPAKYNPLCNHDKVSVTPHIGASTREAQGRIGEEIIDIILDFWKGEQLNGYVESI